MTREMAVDFGPDGIRVNAVCPGLIVHARNGADDPKRYGDPAFAGAKAVQYPVGQYGAPEDIAAAVRFLCSEEASFITGVAAGAGPQGLMHCGGSSTMDLEDSCSVQK